MTSRTRPLPGPALLRATALGLALLLGGCSGTLLPKPAPLPVLYAIDTTTAAAGAPTASPASATPPAAAPRPNAPTLLLSAPRAAAGYDTRLIAYQRQPNRIDYYASSEWVDTPAQMLSPLLARAVEQTGAFRAVLRAPSSATAELRLDTELVRLQHDFGAAPSRVRLTLRAVLIDSASRRVLATREFDTTAPAASEDAAGGVAAAQQAARQLAQELAAFCAGSVPP